MWTKMFKWFKKRFVGGNRKVKSGVHSDNPFLIL